MKALKVYFLFYFCVVVRGYQFPEVTIEALSPKGVKVTLPFTKGDTLFGFHANVNKRIGQREIGDFSQDATKRDNGKWVIRDSDLSLKKGDKINYWMFMSHNALGYKHAGTYVVESVKSKILPDNCTSTAKIEEVLSNITQNVQTLQDEVSSLKKVNNILKELVKKDQKLSTTLTLDGISTTDDEMKMLVQAIITNKLELPFSVKNVRRTENGRVQFEVGSIDEKLQVILAATTKLKHSRYSLTY